MQRASRKGLLPAPPGTPRPLDEDFVKALASAEFNFILLPMPSAPSKKESGSGASSSAEISALRKEVAGLKTRLQTPPQIPSGGGKGKGGKGTGKGGKKTKSKPMPGARGTGFMPKGLEHCVAQDADGKRLCFGFNLGTCKAKSNCPRGRHVCARAGCFGPHPESECTH